MANPLRGEVEFTTASGKKHKLRFGTNAQCEIEAEFGVGIGEVVKKLAEEKRLTPLRAILRILLGGKMSVEQVGDLMDEVGLLEMTALMMQAVGIAQPDPEEGESSRPPVPAGETLKPIGNGLSSTASPPG